jgi:hypothetical protein
MSSALIVAACGRQVTPNRGGTGPGGLQPGFMSVKFRVQSAFNFSTDSYLIVFNTANVSSTQTVTPVAAAVNTGYAGYSLGIAVGGAGGAVSAQAYSYYRPNGQTSQSPVLYPILATPQQLILNLNTNGQNTEFTVLFDRNIAAFNVQTTAAPSASPTASPTASPSPSPSASASASPSSSPTASPAAPGNVSQFWTYNFFTLSGSVTSNELQQNVTIVDSLGQNGGTDQSYVSQVLNIGNAFDETFYTVPGNHPTGASDAITGGEIANNP